MDRASVAVRSTVSHDELEALVETGKVRDGFARWCFRFRTGLSHSVCGLLLPSAD